MKEREALKLALDALKIEQAALAYEHGKVEHIENAITAAEEALAQPEQEPVIDKSAAIRIATSLGWTPQRTWVGLTDEEVRKIAYNTSELKVAKDIETKLKEKNDC